MGLTHLIAVGRRLMFPSDRETEDHKKRLTIAAEVITYARPDSAGDPKDLEVAFIRSFHLKAWTFRVIALEVDTGQILATTTVETWAEARQRLEAELHDMGLIAG
jgi:hypothetical protein